MRKKTNISEIAVDRSPRADHILRSHSTTATLADISDCVITAQAIVEFNKIAFSSLPREEHRLGISPNSLSSSYCMHVVNRFPLPLGLEVNFGRW